jgi:hypothetical protein
MVGVVGSSPIAPTKIGTEIRHLVETLGAFFLGVQKKYKGRSAARALQLQAAPGASGIASEAISPCHPTFTLRKRSAFPITLTDDNAMAAAATTGDSSRPNKGYSTPAARGMPATL